MTIINPDELKFIKKISWKEVFSKWEKNERGREEWQKLMEKNKFSNWSEWRISYFVDLDLPQRKWQLFKIKDPLATAPNFFCGDFPGWENFYQTRAGATFAQISQNQFWAKSEKIKKILENFPKQTQLVGLRKNGQITIIEGSHRSVALSILAHQAKKLKSVVEIVLTDYAVYEENEFVTFQ